MQFCVCPPTPTAHRSSLNHLGMRQSQPQLQPALLGEHVWVLYPVCFRRVECVVYSAVHLNNVIPHCKATPAMIQPSAAGDTGSCVVPTARVTWLLPTRPSRPHNGRFAASQTSVFLGMESTEHHRGVSASWHRASLFLSRLRRAVSALRHHAPVTAPHFSPGLTKHTREREKDRRDGERKRCLAFNLSLSAAKNEWALSLLAGRKNRTVIVISQQAPELAHLFTPTNTQTPPCIHLCLFPPLFFFLIHPPFFCCWRAYASTRAPFLLLLNPGTNETSGFVNHSEQASVTPTFSEHFCRSDTGGRLTFRERIGYASWSSVANIIIIIISALTELLSGLHCGR